MLSTSRFFSFICKQKILTFFIPKLDKKKKFNVQLQFYFTSSYSASFSRTTSEVFFWALKYHILKNSFNFLLVCLFLSCHRMRVTSSFGYFTVLHSDNVRPLSSLWKNRGFETTGLETQQSDGLTILPPHLRHIVLPRFISEIGFFEDLIRTFIKRGVGQGTLILVEK